LNPRERRFVEEFIVDLNAKQAAIRAGLGRTPKSGMEIASRLRKKATVSAAISALMTERSGVTGAGVITEIARLAFAKMPDYAKIQNGALVITDTADLTEDQQAAISEITETVTEAGRTIRIKLHDKGAALDKLAKILSLYRERVELSGPNGGAIPLEAVVSARERVAERMNAIKRKIEPASASRPQLALPAPSAIKTSDAA
jgi:phage terminase small subunit